MVTERDIVPLLNRIIHPHHRSDGASRQLLWVTHRDTIADREAHTGHYHDTAGKLALVGKYHRCRAHEQVKVEL